MPDEPLVIRGIDWKATFPFVGLFRGFRVAIHPSKLILALVALMLIYFGGRALDGMWLAESRAVPGELQMYGMSQASVKPSADFTKRRSDARKRIVDEFNAQLKAIPSDPPKTKLADIEWTIKDRMNKHVDEIRKKFDELPGDQKTPHAELARDTEINAAYAIAGAELDDVRAIEGEGLFDTFCSYEVGTLNQMVGAVRQGNWLGAGGVVDNIRSFFIFAPVWAVVYHPFFFTIFFLYFLCVWSVFGGAIARIAAVHVARDEKISIRQALRFSTSKFLSFLSAPIIPMLIVVAVGLVIAIGGILVNIPFLGPIVLGAFFFLALVAGFVMTLVMLGTGGGFNLMYPTIAVEGSDSFDAISRSFSYLYARPWRMAFYSGVAILYGSICYIFVRYFLYLMLSLTHKFVGLFIGAHAYNTLPAWNVMWPSPSTVGRLTYDINYLPLSAGQKVGAFLVMVWVYLAIGLLGAFAVSFYFSANTIIYFLMRNEVDATELDDVYLEQADDEFAETAPAIAATTTPVEVAAPIGSGEASLPPAQETPAGDAPPTS